MDTTNKHDWGLVIAGVLLVICSMFFLFAPGLALVTITVIAGAAFLVSGIFDIVNYFRFRRAMDLSGWALAYGALDIVLGILFLVNPLVSAGALAWFIGAFFIVFGVFEVVGAFKVRNMGASMWGWMLFSGVISIVIGFMFFSMPEMLALFIALFALLRGVDLIVVGANAGKYFL